MKTKTQWLGRTGKCRSVLRRLNSLSTFPARSIETAVPVADAEHRRHSPRRTVTRCGKKRGPSGELHALIVRLNLGQTGVYVFTRRTFLNAALKFYRATGFEEIDFSRKVLSEKTFAAFSVKQPFSFIFETKGSGR